MSRIRESKQRMPGEGTRKRARTLAVRLLAHLEDVEAALAPVLARAAASVGINRGERRPARDIFRLLGLAQIELVSHDS